MYIPFLLASHAQIGGEPQRGPETKEATTQWRHILDELETRPRKHRHQAEEKVFLFFFISERLFWHQKLKGKQIRE